MNLPAVVSPTHVSVDLMCPTCRYEQKGVMVAANMELYVTCGRCTERWHIDTSPRGLRLMRTQQRTYHPAATHDDASKFRRRMRQYAKRAKA